MGKTTLTADGYNHWRDLRRKLYRRWWAWMALAVATGIVFVINLTTREPNVFAALLLVPLLCLRSAWKIDREIQICAARMAELRGDAENRTSPGRPGEGG
jgi:hypothetical protein